ncbi:MAG: flagellin [Ignisphaera sp.]|nr:flagellin [Ignisphaera sp.]
MKTTNPTKKVRKGIVGIEAAIVLIAFVVVAAALAFVALNMGFYTTQRSKEVMSAGLSQASSSLEIDGSVLAKIDTGETTERPKVECIVIPIRLSAGQKDVDLTPNKTTIALWVVNKFGYTNIYSKSEQAISDLDNKNYDLATLCDEASEGVAIIWGPGSNGDTVLGPGEKALIVINFGKIDANNVNVESYDVIKVEIKPPIGAALTVERTVPASLTAEIMDFG